MLTSSPSPTLSAPDSPSTSFHQHCAYHGRPSPRFPPQTARSRLPQATIDAPATAPITIPSSSSPALSFATKESQQQQQKRSEYADASTQYTPPGPPPTARHARQHPISEPSPSSSAVRAGTKRRETSADVVTTEPPTPSRRVEPEENPTVTEPDGAQPPPQSTGGGTEEGMEEAPKETAVASSAAGVQLGEAQQQQQSEPSAAKRARNGDPSVTVMPLQYETCDVKDLGVLISDMLMELVRLNDGIPLQDGQLTRFHSRAPPGISVKDYLTRLVVHATLPPPILLSMVYYVDRLCALYPAFTISSLTVHRFLITAATVASKGLSDSFWTNSLYARVGGVSLRELALLELEFLRRLDWRIVPKPEVLVDYYRGLVERGKDFVMEKEQQREPGAVQLAAGQEVASTQSGSGSSSSMDVFIEPATAGPPVERGP